MSLRPTAWTPRLILAWLAMAAMVLTLAGCETMTGRDALRVSVVGVEPLKSEGLELRFVVKLRVQNPSEAPVDFDGVSLDLEVNGKNLASGVSSERGSVPRLGETLLSVPVSVSAFALVRQAMGLTDASARGDLPYVVSGKLAGGAFGNVRFSNSGTLKLPH
jgi:LEA14-like dessication related protein